MKAIGIIRRVDELGRIVIPKEIRRQYGIKAGTPVECFLTNEGIVLQPCKTESISEDITKLILKVGDNYETLGKSAAELMELLEKASDLTKELVE